MSRIWRSSLSKELKVRFFIETVESILLYGCEAWALTEAMEHSLDGTYTRMLRKALNIQRYWGHDWGHKFDLLRSRDVIGHVTIRLGICGFLLVVHCDHASILHR